MKELSLKVIFEKHHEEVHIKESESKYVSTKYSSAFWLFTKRICNEWVHMCKYKIAIPKLVFKNTHENEFEDKTEGTNAV
jgi:hypothetical protein